MAKTTKTVSWDKDSETANFRIIYNDRNLRFIKVKRKVRDGVASYDNLLVTANLNSIEQLVVKRKRAISSVRPFYTTDYLDYQVQFKTPYPDIVAIDEKGKASHNDKLGNELVPYYDEVAHVNYFSVSKEVYNQLMTVMSKFIDKYNEKQWKHNTYSDVNKNKQNN